MRRLNRIINEDTVTDINISPLIDMMFLLLIFFIVTASFVQESGVEINRPQASSATMLDKQSIIIGVDSSDRIFMGGNEIELSQVRTLVAANLRNEKKSAVIVADEKSRSGIVIHIVDECRLAGVEDVSVATEE
ncbi:MAG: biopolymer transporter ExbD [Candidatus Muirbacterium halophilum]|nr:biopolymer transporter ExbD [Candidatus Muirbacterium halophilum]MCK9475901.1 biopolymer transporter ExbD [Candidatus Muirbacterium halophilum]